jgi:hypothetical protein
MRVAVLVMVGSVASASAAYSADITSDRSPEGTTIVSLSGNIEAGDSQSLEKIIKTSNDASRVVSAIRLNSPGGSLLEGAKLADIIRYGKVATVVPAGSQCASACFLVFAAGTEKFASYRSNVGVHGASDRSGEEAGDATVSMGRIARDLGVPANIIGKMVVTPPGEIVWLSPDDLRSMGATITGKPSQLPPQQAPEAPLQLNPSARADAPAARPKWEDIVQGAFDVSKQQNNGQARTGRVCEPEKSYATWQ